MKYIISLLYHHEQKENDYTKMEYQKAHTAHTPPFTNVQI